ncbi:MAG: MFS transporter [Desulfuromonadales bacterium]
MSTSVRQSSGLLLLRVFAPVALGYFLSYLFRVVNAVIAPNLSQDLALDAAGLGLLTSVYFLAFAAFQLPLGVLLDRYGPRRTESALLLIAAAGALLFARAESLTALVAARALIGLGASACLMAAFKAFVLWFPAPRLPLINGLQMAAGGLGAITATAPVEALLRVTDWRGIFTLLALLTFLVAVAVFTIVPEQPGEGAKPDLRLQLLGIATIFRNRFFWRIAPWTVASQTSFLAIQGLWAGPWLRDVAGLARPEIAQVLLLIAIAMVAGFFLLGWMAERLGRRGISPMTVAAVGMGVFMLAQLPLVFQWSLPVRPLWLLFGFCGTVNILPYAALSQSVPAQLAGRAITGLNLLVFVAAFAAQWGIGAVIGLWPPVDAGFSSTGYRAAFGLILAIQVMGGVWFAIAGRKEKRRPNGRLETSSGGE